MQHDIIELLDFIKYAKDNFGDDVNSNLYFTRKELVDGFGKPYREDKAMFDCVIIFGWVRETKIEIKVIGLNDDVQFQKEFITGVINDHRSAQVK